jgi:hypothetical protein
MTGTHELDSAGDYGYAIYVAIMPPGGATLEQAASEKHYLMKPPIYWKAVPICVTYRNYLVMLRSERPCVALMQP